MAITTLIFMIIGYLLGSISSAILVCKLTGLPDPRTQGSGNPGATNVLRVGGKTMAAIVLLFDALKGLLPVLLAKLLGLPNFAVGLVALAAIVGHMYPLYFKFQGGKGVATLLGVLAAIHWLVFFLVVLTWAIVAWCFRYSSLAALVATALMPFFAWIIGGFGYFLPLLVLAGLIFYRHRGNIERLRAGTEPKLGKKK